MKADEVQWILIEKIKGIKVFKIGKPPKKVLITVKDLEFNVIKGAVRESVEKVTEEIPYGSQVEAGFWRYQSDISGCNGESGKGFVQLEEDQSGLCGL